MQRFSTTEEREAQLSEWESQLSDRERDVDAAIKTFRNHMSEEVRKVTELQKDVAMRENALAQRNQELSDREEKLLQMMGSYQEVLSAGATGGADQSAAGSKKTSSSSSPAGSPMSAGGRSYGQRSHHSTRSDGVSPAKYTEGKVDVDPAIASYVEELSASGSDASDEDDENRKPRGLQGSPNFHPMDPNASGMGWLRRKSSVVTLKQEDSMMQDDFDEACEFLINNGLMSPEEVVEMINQGIDPQTLIAQMKEELIRQHRAAAAGGDPDMEGGVHDDDMEGAYYDDNAVPESNMRYQEDTSDEEEYYEEEEDEENVDFDEEEEERQYQDEERQLNHFSSNENSASTSPKKNQVKNSNNASNASSPDKHSSSKGGSNVSSPGKQSSKPAESSPVAAARYSGFDESDDEVEEDAVEYDEDSNSGDSSGGDYELPGTQNDSSAAAQDKPAAYSAFDDSDESDDNF